MKHAIKLLEINITACKTVIENCDKKEFGSGSNDLFLLENIKDFEKAIMILKEITNE